MVMAFPALSHFRCVPKIAYGRGCIRMLESILAECEPRSGAVVYLIDRFFEARELPGTLPIRDNDLVLFFDSSHEPGTWDVDSFRDRIRATLKNNPSAIVGIGGGSTLDLAKAVSVLLTNGGSACDYQGWDRVRHPGVYKIGIPTISGTGSEVSRTAVLTGPGKKQGINSDHSIFDQIILDPELLSTVLPEQRFFTGMDCYIHSVEALSGTFISEFSRAYADKALGLCRRVFAGSGTDDDMMVASFFGGAAIVQSEVGICHALSYGISQGFGIRHGEGNCIVFQHLGEYYGERVREFQELAERNGIQLRQGLCRGISDELLDKMIDVTLLMEKPLWNTVGENWKSIFTRGKLKDLYLRI